MGVLPLLGPWHDTPVWKAPNFTCTRDAVDLQRWNCTCPSSMAGLGQDFCSDRCPDIRYSLKRLLNITLISATGQNECRGNDSMGGICHVELCPCSPTNKTLMHFECDLFQSKWGWREVTPLATLYPGFVACDTMCTPSGFEEELPTPPVKDHQVTSSPGASPSSGSSQSVIVAVGIVAAMALVLGVFVIVFRRRSTQKASQRANEMSSALLDKVEALFLSNRWSQSDEGSAPEGSPLSLKELAVSASDLSAGRELGRELVTRVLCGLGISPRFGVITFLTRTCTLSPREGHRCWAVWSCVSWFPQGSPGEALGLQIGSSGHQIVSLC